MDGNRRVHIAETKKIKRKTKEKSNLSTAYIEKKEHTGILKKKESLQEIPQSNTDSSPHEENRVLDSVAGSGEVIQASHTFSDEAQSGPGLDLVSQPEDGEGRQEKLNSSKTWESEGRSESDFSEDELPGRQVVDSDYDTDLEMNDHSKLGWRLRLRE